MEANPIQGDGISIYWRGSIKPCCRGCRKIEGSASFHTPRFKFSPNAPLPSWRFVVSNSVPSRRFEPLYRPGVLRCFFEQMQFGFELLVDRRARASLGALALMCWVGEDAWHKLFCRYRPSECHGQSLEIFTIYHSTKCCYVLATFVHDVQLNAEW